MLTSKNEYTYLRRELATRVLRLYFEGRLEQQIDRIPIQLIPRGQDSSRCCIHKDRAMIRARLLSLLGVDLSSEDDEYSPPSHFVEQALCGPFDPFPLLTTLPTGCSACPGSQYRVTELCRGCLARPCQTNCPKQAIRIVNSKAVIDTELCVNCGICQGLCPFSAINHIPVPCEDVCPTGAICKEPTGEVRIDRKLCIDCGRCTRACPFGAIVERSQILQVARRLKGGQHVSAIIAPSIEGQFPGTLGQIIAALYRIGFDAVFEAALGAVQTVQKEAAELEESTSFLTTSCCPAFVKGIRTQVPGLQEHISSTPSPMVLTGRMARRALPESYIVFIGPCIAKKAEGALDPDIDAVLTFEELSAFFLASGIEIDQLEEHKIALEEPKMRSFAVSGSVSELVCRKAGIDPEGQRLVIDGLSKKSLALLRSHTRRPPAVRLIEGMACEEGCIGGPGCLVDARLRKKRVPL